MNVDYMTLISGVPFQTCGVLVYPPTLRDIQNIGYDIYESFLSIFFLSLSDLMKGLGVNAADIPKTTTSMQVITKIPDLRAALLRSLRFFLHSDIRYADDVGYFITSGDQQLYLTLNDIKEIRGVILQLCNLQDDMEPTPVTFKNAKAQQIYEKIQAKKAEKQKMQKQSSSSFITSLPNLISAVAAYSPTYNLFNIWDLTVYQFYDQFARLNDSAQMQVFGQRWAAWGTEDFDFSVWYRPLFKSQ